MCRYMLSDALSRQIPGARCLVEALEDKILSDSDIDQLKEH